MMELVDSSSREGNVNISEKDELKNAMISDTLETRLRGESIVCSPFSCFINHYINTQRGRTTGHNQWSWAMERRDDRIEQMRALKRD